MKKISEFIKSLGFTFSFRRLRKAILLILLFSLIGIGVFIFYEFESSESGLKRIYAKEIATKMDLQDNTIIKIYKKDINDDRSSDYIFIMGKEIRSSNNTLNSIIELYKEVNLVIIDGKTSEIAIYKTNKDFKSDVTLKINEDEKDRYFMISDLSGNVCLCKLDKTEGIDINNCIIDIVKNTSENVFLGYTIYTQKDSGNSNIVNVTLDNYSKNYLGEYKEVKKLDFTNTGIDISKYRETYLRDKFSKFILKDTNNDGVLEFIAYQYILYSLDDDKPENETLGLIQTIFNIEENRLNFNKVEISI